VSSIEFATTNNGTDASASPRVRSDVVRLFCFPYAGGGASMFRPWTTALAPAIEVCPVQLPGREDRWREPALRDLFALVPRLADALRGRLVPPFAFFGHSMGAFVAFELTRYLRREPSAQPNALIVSGARAPQLPDPDPQTHLLPHDELLTRLRRLGGIPIELLNHPELMSLLLPTISADLALCETYTYRDEPPLECPIAVYGGYSDDKVPQAHLSPWKVQTTGDFSLRMFPGNHFFFLKEARHAVLQAIRDELRRSAQPDSAPSVISPRAGIERAIAAVWCELLRVPSVALDDNFFDLGGNSLLMVQAHFRLRQSVSTSLSVLDLFRYPTIRLLANAMELADPTAGAGPFARFEKESQRE